MTCYHAVTGPLKPFWSKWLKKPYLHSLAFRKQTQWPEWRFLSCFKNKSEDLHIHVQMLNSLSSELLSFLWPNLFVVVIIIVTVIVGVRPESDHQKNPLSGYKGGEARALQLLASRVEKERGVSDCSVTEWIAFSWFITCKIECHFLHLQPNDPEWKKKVKRPNVFAKVTTEAPE